MVKAKRANRNINGILLLDKPKGLSSNQALQIVKRLFNASKAGHTGSLDPLATGMLPICLGEATKFSGFLLDADKRYSAECQLGIRTDSADADGAVISERPWQNVSVQRVTEVLKTFVGDLWQTPPMHSALKRNGIPLYKLARQGITIERKARPVTVFSLELDEFSGNSMEISIHCSKGTYVRTVVDDIGEALGCGAHIVELRRVSVGPFCDKTQMHAIDKLNILKEQGVTYLDELLLPIESGLSDWPVVELDRDVSIQLCQGQSVNMPQVKSAAYVRLHGPDGQFLGVGSVGEMGQIVPKRLMNQSKIG